MSVLTSAGSGLVAPSVAGLGAGFPSSGVGAGPGGNTSGPFMPQAARPMMINTAAILDIGGDAVSKERDVSTRWMTRNSTAWLM